MKSKRSRLDRYLSEQLAINRKDVRLLLAQGRVKLDHKTANSIQQLVDEYTHVQFDGQVLQAKQPHYIQLHKPKGVVSATKDPKHTTVLDLLPTGQPDNLHIVGRLDFNSTGLLLLTNDGRWSRRLSEPSSNIFKRYVVTLDKPVTEEVIATFAEGIYFAYEDITTRPVTLHTLTEDKLCAEVIMAEGRYHQIKRMFGYFQTEVLSLHRTAVGNLTLDEQLEPGQSRELTVTEVSDIFNVVPIY